MRLSSSLLLILCLAASAVSGEETRPDNANRDRVLVKIYSKGGSKDDVAGSLKTLVVSALEAVSDEDISSEVIEKHSTGIYRRMAPPGTAPCPEDASTFYSVVAVDVATADSSAELQKFLTETDIEAEIRAANPDLCTVKVIPAKRGAKFSVLRAVASPGDKSSIRARREAKRSGAAEGTGRLPSWGLDRGRAALNRTHTAVGGEGRRGKHNTAGHGTKQRGDGEEAAPANNAHHRPGAHHGKAADAKHKLRGHKNAGDDEPAAGPVEQQVAEAGVEEAAVGGEAAQDDPATELEGDAEEDAPVDGDDVEKEDEAAGDEDDQQEEEAAGDADDEQEEEAAGGEDEATIGEEDEAAGDEDVEDADNQDDEAAEDQEDEAADNQDDEAAGDVEDEAADNQEDEAAGDDEEEAAEDQEDEAAGDEEDEAADNAAGEEPADDMDEAAADDGATGEEAGKDEGADDADAVEEGALETGGADPADEW